MRATPTTLMQLYHFTSKSEAKSLPTDGFRDCSVGIRWPHAVSGVDLSDSTRGDAYDQVCSWLIVVEVDESVIAKYEIGTSRLARLVSRGRRHWNVPAEVLNEQAHVVEIGDFKSPGFASRYMD
jgi:hypothetical protein